MVGPFFVLALAMMWVVLAASLAGLGMLVVRSRSRSTRFSSRQFRQSLWVGLLLVTVVALLLGIVWPLGSGIALWVLLVLIGFGLLIATWQMVAAIRQCGSAPSARWWICGVVLGILLLVCAGWALGEPTNYDTGLYHIGAINYARDFPTITGLANLHERFGFNSSMWPLSAWLGSLGWAGNEYRLVNGLLLTLLLADAALRLVGAKRTPVLPGTVITVLGSILVLGAMAQYPGRLLASSAQDSAALILGLVAVAYFSDAMARRRWWERPEARAALSVAVIAAISGALMRPLGWVLAAGIWTVALVVAALGREMLAAARSLAPVTVVAVLAGVLMGVRDYILSGWLLYPAGLIGFRVEWRYPDPSVSSDRIAAWARTPFQDVQSTLADSSWVGGWLQRLPTDWSIPALGALLGLAGLLWWLSRGRRDQWLWRGCVAALAPVALLLIAWFITAPDPRFAWAGIVGLGLVPVGFLAQDVPPTRLLFGAGAVLAALLVLASVRGSWEAWSWRAVAPPTAEIIDGELDDGTAVVMPTPGDQCWETYPFCRPQYESPAIERRGTGLADGFRPIPNAS